MARFYASIQGNRGEATRIGTASSGIYGHIRGWDVGVAVRANVIDGEDVLEVYRTEGSNNPNEGERIAVVSAQGVVR